MDLFITKKPNQSTQTTRTKNLPHPRIISKIHARKNTHTLLYRHCTEQGKRSRAETEIRVCVSRLAGAGADTTTAGAGSSRGCNAFFPPSSDAPLLYSESAGARDSRVARARAHEAAFTCT